jgi:hypothetical protein
MQAARTDISSGKKAIGLFDEAELLTIEGIGVSYHDFLFSFELLHPITFGEIVLIPTL